MGLKNKDKSAKMKVQKNHQKIPYNVFIKPLYAFIGDTLTKTYYRFPLNVIYNCIY